MSGDKTTVKTEAGGTFKRLPSFKSPRDLNLSQFMNPGGDARTKKTFVPNLNVQRRKQNESQAGGSAESRINQRERNKRGTRPITKKSFVQAQGVFSEGLAPQMRKSFFSSGCGGGGGGSGGGSGSGKVNNESGPNMPIPTLNLNEPMKVDPNEEDLIMKELMRDDFLDDPSLQPDMDYSPVPLPLKKFENLKVKEIKEETPAVEEHQVNGLKIKKETPQVPQPKEVIEEKPINLSERRCLSAAEILENRANDSNFIFFQIPNSIPRLKVPEMIKAVPSKKDAEEEEFDKCSLRSLPAGQIGKLQILKSGRARLLLGDVQLKIESGKQVAYKEELVSVDLNPSEKNGNIIHLGNITTRIRVSPEWDTLLKNGKAS